MKNRKRSFLSKSIFLCIITTSIVTIFSFSKFQSTLKVSRGKSRIAVPVLNVMLAEQQEQNLTIDCNTENTSASYKILVSNEEENKVSEVSLKYSIVVNLPTEVPKGLTVKVDEEIASQLGTKYTVKNVGRFDSNVSKENIHTLTFEADSTIIRNIELNDIIVTVYAEQID